MWLADLYETLIVEPGKQALFFLLMAFIVTFLCTRLSVRMIRAGVSWWPRNVVSGDVHVHHVVFGTVLMLVAGFMAFAPVGGESPWREVLGALFGVGSALVLDEFALILHLDDVYWSEKGRTSIDSVVLAAALVGLLLLGALPFGVGSVGAPAIVGSWPFVLAIVLGGVLVGVALLKGRVWLGVIGLLFPLFALIGAVRMAKPSSPWARWRYRPGSRRMAVAMARAVRHEARWERLKYRIFDAVAGRPNPTPNPPPNSPPDPPPNPSPTAVADEPERTPQG